MIVSIIFASIVAYFSYSLFKQAAGTLAIGKINIISYIFYLCVLQSYLGTVLISLGYDEHYTLNKLVFPTESIEAATLGVYFMMCVLPFCILAVFKIIKFDPIVEYEVFLKKEIDDKKNNELFMFIILIAIVQIGLLTVLLMQIGYIPLLKLFFSNTNFDFAIERQSNADIQILGIRYIKNVIVIWGIPIIAYITAAYALINRERKWIVLAVIYFMASIITQTYDFSKSPVIFHLFVYLLIFLYYKGGLKNIYIIVFGAIGTIILVFFYRLSGFEGSFFDIYNGILGRIFFSQVGTLCYHFDLFPNIFDYLGGRSLYPTILSIIGHNPSEHLRSSQIVMEFYGSDYVYEGTAGVMNTVFIGEAYANWGWPGVFFSVIWVGIIVALIFILIMKIKKTPATIAFLAVSTKTIGSMVQGGFVDFIYNFTFIIMIIGFIIIIYFNEIIAKGAQICKQIFRKSDI